VSDHAPSGLDLRLTASPGPTFFGELQSFGLRENALKQRDAEVLQVKSVFHRQGASMGTVVPILTDANRRALRFFRETSVPKWPGQPQSEIAARLAIEADLPLRVVSFARSSILSTSVR